MAYFIASLQKQGRHTFGKVLGEVIFERVYWHRLVCDEIHEFGESSKTNRSVKFFQNELYASFYIGLTGYS